MFSKQMWQKVTVSLIFIFHLSPARDLLKSTNQTKDLCYTNSCRGAVSAPGRGNPAPTNMINILSLSLTLARVRFKLRNEGSILGIFWYLLEPLSFFIILLIIASANVAYYPVYLFVGLIVFNFFMAVTTASTKIISENAGTIKSMKINTEIFVLVSLIQYIFSHIFELIVLAGILIWIQIPLIGLFFYPIFFLSLCLFTMGISFVFATIGVFISDLDNVWRIVGRLLWFVTPIFYYAENNPIMHKINLTNPLYHFVSIARELIIYGQITSLKSVSITFLISIFSFIFGLWVFRRYKRQFAERI